MADEINVLNIEHCFSVILLGQRLERINPTQEGILHQTLILENNDITRIENLQHFAHLQQVIIIAARLNSLY